MEVILCILRNELNIYYENGNLNGRVHGIASFARAFVHVKYFRRFHLFPSSCLHGNKCYYVGVGLEDETKRENEKLMNASLNPGKCLKRCRGKSYEY